MGAGTCVMGVVETTVWLLDSCSSQGGGSIFMLWITRCCAVSVPVQPSRQELALLYHLLLSDTEHPGHLCIPI